VAVAKLREPVLSNEEASSRFWIVDKDGLITKARSVNGCIAFHYTDVDKPQLAFIRVVSAVTCIH
jgi:hypothetical protein